MKLYSNPNARTPKKKKKRNYKYERDTEDNFLFSAMVEAAQHVKHDVREGGDSRSKLA